MTPSFWAGKTVAVAGSTGFLGGWLVRRLLECDASVVALLRDPARRSQIVIESLLDRTIVEQGSVEDLPFLDGVFRRHEIDVFMHAAAAGDVDQALREPIECFRASVVSTWMVLDLIRRLQPSCIAVVSSSDNAHGSRQAPYRESEALTPGDPYEVIQASQVLAAQSFGRVYGLPVAVARCANYFGGYDLNFTRLVPGVCRDLANGEVPRLCSDGPLTRDFLYIEDAVDAQLLLAERLAEDQSLYGEAFNFSYGEPVDVLEIVRRLASLAHVAVDPIVADDVSTGPRQMFLCPDKARDRLEWQPAVGFDEGLNRTWAWYLALLRTGCSTPHPKRDDSVSSGTP